MSVPSPSGPWLFDRRTDLFAFGGSAATAGLSVLVGAALGWLDRPFTPLMFGLTVVLCDVAHVWSTLFRLYLDREAFRERPLLYTFAPVFAFAAGAALYQQGDAVFWRVFAYFAVFHFVRQQYGWLSLYRARAGETRYRRLDTAAIYAATLYPLVYWHTHLPRSFDWFIAGDFVALPAALDLPCRAAYVLVMAAYAVRSVRERRRGHANPGRDLLVATTALCWLLGIVVLDSDYAFTLTNVLIHGVPYMVLVRRYGLTHGTPGSLGGRLLRAGWLPYLAVCWALAYGEEWLWDRGVWQDHPGLFPGHALDVEPHWPLLVPLLAVPQVTHYLLDGFIWKRQAAPALHR